MAKYFNGGSSIGQYLANNVAGVTGSALSLACNFMLGALPGASTSAPLMQLATDATAGAVVLSLEVYNDAGTYKLTAYAKFSGSTGEWRAATPNIAVSTWYRACMTYDGSSTSNVPTLWVNGTAYTMTQAVAPVGTFSGGADTLMLASNAGRTVRATVTMSQVAVFPGALDADSAKAISNGFAPIMFRPLPAVYCPLDQNDCEWIAAAAFTIDGSPTFAENSLRTILPSPAVPAVIDRNPPPALSADPITLLYDTFIDTNGVDIASHTPITNYIGGAWTQEILRTGVGTVTADGVEIQGNKLTISVSSNVAVKNVGTGDIDMTFDWEVGSTSGQKVTAHVRRKDEGNQLYWSLAEDNDTIGFASVVGGTKTDIASGLPFTFALGTTYTIRVVARGNRHALYINGTLVASYRSETNRSSANTKIGIGANSITQNVVVDNLTVKTDVMRRQHKVGTWSTDTVTFDAAPLAGNRLVLSLFTRNPASNWVISGSGWSLVAAERNGTTTSRYRNELWVWTKVAGASEPSAITVTVDETGWSGSYQLLAQEFTPTGELVSVEVATSGGASTTSLATANIKMETPPLSKPGLTVGVVGTKESDTSNEPSSDVVVTMRPLGDVIFNDEGTSTSMYTTGYLYNEAAGSRGYIWNMTATNTNNQGSVAAMLTFKPKGNAYSHAGAIKTDTLPAGIVERIGQRQAGVATGTNTATMPEHKVGDLIVAFAGRDGSATAPTVPSGQNWSTYYTGGASSLSTVIAWKIAASTSEGVGTFTNATSLLVMVFRNVNTRQWYAGSTLTTGTATSATITQRSDTSGDVSPLGRLLALVEHAAGDGLGAEVQSLWPKFGTLSYSIDATDAAVAGISVPMRGFDSPTRSATIATSSAAYRAHLLEMSPPFKTVDFAAGPTYDDWIALGNATYSRIDKSGGSGISAISLLGGTPTGVSYTGTSGHNVRLAWNDGAELGSASAHDSVVYWPATAVGHGISFTVPAGRDVRKVKIYLGSYLEQCRLTATLSDGSAPAYDEIVCDGLNSGTDYRTVEITYSAASESQTLTIEFKVSLHYTSGNLAMSGVSLETVRKYLPTILSTSPAGPYRVGQIGVKLVGASFGT